MDKENLSLAIQNPDRSTVMIILGGVADNKSMPLIRQELSFKNQLFTRVILDISSLEHMSSMVIGYFLMLASELQSKGGSLQIKNANPQIADIVRDLGVPGLLQSE